MNECDGNDHECSDNATCTNTIGGHNCTCFDGYSGDGLDCEGNNPIFMFNNL